MAESIRGASLKVFDAEGGFHQFISTSFFPLRAVDNEKHSDFTKLRQMLIRTHMEELKAFTHTSLYENYRSQKHLASTTGGGSTALSSHDGRFSPQDLFGYLFCNSQAAQFEKEKLEHDAKMVKLETEMQQIFNKKVAEKEKRLHQTEEEVLCFFLLKRVVFVDAFLWFEEVR